jgi:hypothetical protein
MAAYIESHGCSEGGEDPKDGMRSMFGPMQVDQLIRQAISTCWMLMPAEKKNVDAVEAEIRRQVDRALKNMRDDAQSMGF